VSRKRKRKPRPAAAGNTAYKPPTGPARSAEEHAARLREAELLQGLPEGSLSPDWAGRCMQCGESPTLRLTGLCGPCTFGEAETYGGNW
jgi:hypothetical protein